MIAGLYPFTKRWHSQGTLWIYSDPHFNDEDLSKKIKRPSAEEQIKMINSKVGKNDTLIILGDIGDINCVRQLRGYKILIAGNHDKGLSNYEEVFDEIYGGPLIISPKLILSHEPLDVSWAFNIHGHNHLNSVNDINHLNVCSDVIKYTPINMNQLMKTGILSKIDSIHRCTIDKATKRKEKLIKHNSYKMYL